MEEDRFDINVLLEKISSKRKKLVRIFLVLMLLFFVYTFFFYKKKYESKIVFLPNISSSSIISSRLGGVAALAGINFGEGAEKNLSPELYDNILNSKSFLEKLSNIPITILNKEDKESQISYREYYKLKNPESLFSKFKKLIGLEKDKKQRFSKSEIRRYSDSDLDVFKSLQNSLRFSYESEENLVVMETVLDDALASSELLLYTVDFLKDELAEIKTFKLKDELEFIEKRYEEKLKEFKNTQLSLADFEDKNQFLKTSRSKTRLLNLRADYDLLFSICSELQKQVETKKIQLKETIPYMSIIEPITVPVKKSGLRKSLMLLIGIFLNIFLVLFYVFAEDFYFKLKNRDF